MNNTETISGVSLLLSIPFVRKTNILSQFTTDIFMYSASVVTCEIYLFEIDCIYIYIYIYISGWIFEKVIDSYKPDVPSTSLPNFPVSSSYKIRNCLNVRTSLDILDNRHPRK